MAISSDINVDGAVATTQQPVVDLAMPALRFDLARWVIEVRRRHGRGYLAQARDILRLRKPPTCLPPLDYYIYHLYAPERCDPALRGTFIGERARVAIYERLSERAAVRFDDKLVTAAQVVAHGHQTPQVYALYQTSAREGDWRCFGDAVSLAGFLREGMTYPCFGKPAHSTHSFGVAAITGYEPDRDCLIFKDGRRVPVDDFIASIESYAGQGYMFQELLRPHPEIRRLFGDRLCSVRVMVLVDGQEPEAFRTMCKVPGGNNVGDNVWRPGNMIGKVDPGSGRLENLLTGWGLDEVQVDRHPDTDALLTDVVLPDWQAAKQAALDLATRFDGMLMQAWDIALTDRGPVVLEVNGAGGQFMPQRTWGVGLFDERLKLALARAARRKAS